MAGKIPRILVRILIILVLFSQGLCFGFLCAGKPSPVAPEAAKPVEPSPLDDARTVEVVLPQKHREMAEQFLVADDPNAALPHLLKAARYPAAGDEDDLGFRMALCFEAATAFERAATIYKEIAQRSTDPALAGSCRVGLARCLLRTGDNLGARPLLWRQCFLGAADKPRHLQGDSLMWLAQSYNIYSQYELADLLEPGVLIPVTQPTLNVARQLNLLLHARSAARTDNQKNTGIAESQLQGNGGILIEDVIKGVDSRLDTIASYHVDQANLLNLFGWISANLEVPLNITDAARSLASQRSISLYLPGCELDTALDVQTLPFGLDWFHREEAITICLASEIPVEERGNLARSTATRLLDRFQIAHSNHEYLQYGRFQYAVALALGGQTVKAVEIFDSLLEKGIDDQLRQAVNFNLGQMYGLLLEEKAAVDAFSRVVDSNHLGVLQGIGYIKLGFMHLEFGEHQEAASAFSRAQQVCNDKYLRHVARIGLASAYYFDGQFRLAEKLMSDSIHQYKEVETRNAALFLVALCKTMQPGENSQLPNKRELLAALTRQNWPIRLGVHGHYLASAGYRVLGFRDQSTEVARMALDKATGPWLRRQLFRQIVDNTTNYDRLREVLLQSAEQPDLHESGYVYMRLARLEYEAERPRTSLEYCRFVLADEKMAPFHASALKQMGNIYDEEGKYYHAALCYAGLMPDQDNEQADQDTIEVSQK